MNNQVELPNVSELFATSRDWLLTHVADWHVLLQVLVMIFAFALAWVLARRWRPALRSHIRRFEARSRLRRLLDVMSEQLAIILFLPLLWILIGIARHVTWPSYSYLLGIIATLVSAWVLIRIISAGVRSPTLARVVAVLAWTMAALHITGLLEPVIRFMDAIAVTLGDLRLSLLTVAKGSLLLALLLWGALATSRILESRISRMPEVAPSVRVLLGMASRIVFLSLAVVIALNSVGIDLTALAVLSGAIGVGIGFGLQKVISNLISGVILLLDRSVKPGDVIQLGDTFGWITSLGARYVSLVTRDGKEYLIPNEDLITHEVVNWSYTNELVRIETTIRAAYDANPHLVRKVAVEAASRPTRVTRAVAPVCHLREFGDSSLEYLLRFWINDPKNGVENVTGEVLLAVWDAFEEHGIRVPYPQRDLNLRQPVRLEGIRAGGGLVRPE